MVEHVSATQTYAALEADAGACLIDVRTEAEWQFVGLPLAPGNRLALIAWQGWPGGVVNPRFVDELREAGLAEERALYFICRSGVRSAAAARAALAGGYQHCFNVAGGFEGDADELGHRGGVSGWKAEGLPWRQG